MSFPGIDIKGAAGITKGNQTQPKATEHNRLFFCVLFIRNERPFHFGTESFHFVPSGLEVAVTSRGCTPVTPSGPLETLGIVRQLSVSQPSNLTDGRPTFWPPTLFVDSWGAHS